tara:strand:- start:1347 stop:1541 length:195 start_codon:yes stop_codon:yes gene_type:complete
MPSPFPRKLWTLRLEFKLSFADKSVPLLQRRLFHGCALNRSGFDHARCRVRTSDILFVREALYR